jgi:hypothetical protein
MRGVSQKGDTSSPDMSPNTAKSYSRFKTFNGKQYTGMKVGNEPQILFYFFSEEET